MENQNKDHVSESSYFKRFVKKAEGYVKQPLRIKDLLNDAYSKASERKDFGTIAGEVMDSLGTLSRMIKSAVSKEYHGIPNSVLVMGVAVIIYFLSPIDLIPDWIPVIGLLDDAALLAWFMTSIKDEMDRFLDWEATSPKKGASAQTASASGVATTVDSSSQTPKYSHQEETQHDSNQESASNSRGNMHVGNSSSGLQGSTGGVITNQTDSKPVTNFNTVEGAQDQQKDSADTRSSDHSGHTSTTDSTRVPSSNNSDQDNGGNVR